MGQKFHVFMAYIFALLQGCCFSVTKAQDYNLRFHSLSINNGLSYNKVTSVIQDREGYLWFATKDGLNKYDGYRFTVYRNIAQDSNSLSNNRIFGFCLTEDHQGYIWVGTQKGLNRFDKSTGKFTRYSADKLSGYSITCVYEDSRKNLWVGTVAGLFLFNRTNNCFVKFRGNAAKDSPDDYYSKIFDAGNGVLYLATNNGVRVLDTKSQKFRLHPACTQNALLANSKITDIFPDSNGNLWICTFYNGVFCYTRNKQVKRMQFPNVTGNKEGNTFFFCLEDNNRHLWFGSGADGLFEVTNGGDSVINYKNNVDDPTSLASDVVHSAFQDRSGLLWFCTMNGISYLDRNVKFKNYQKVANNHNGKANNYVTSFANAGNGNIWVGTDGGGLCQFNTKTGLISPYKYNHKLKSQKIIDIEASPDGKLWVGTWGGGLHSISASGEVKSWLAPPNNKKGLASPDILSLALDANENLWIATFFEGIACFDQKNGNFVNFNSDSDTTRSISKYVCAIHGDRQGNVWIGNLASGVSKLQYDKNKPVTPENAKLYRFLKNQATREENIQAFFEDSHKNFWVGTQNGLLLFYPQLDSVKVYTVSDGLAGNSICGILEDFNNNLWISTTKGISKFERKSETFKNFDVNDGLQSNQFNNHACFRHTDGSMYFGGVNGFNVFHPDSIRNNSYLPPVVITDFKIFKESVPIGREINGRVILPKSLASMDKITLRYDESMISFDFAALNYIAPEKNQYAYMLEGFDQTMHYVGSERSATYTNLYPGEYVFRVIASNNDGLWNNNGIAVKIVILPPWYKTWWAYCLYFGVALLILLFLRQAALAKEKTRSQHALEKLGFEKAIEISKKNVEVEQMKINFFTNISHEFRTPLTLIIGPLTDLLENEKLQRYNNEFRLILRNAHRLLRLINQLIDFDKIGTAQMKLSVSENDICAFINSITASFNMYARQRGVNYQVIHQIPACQGWFDADILEKIIFNLLSNAFKYTPEQGSIVLETQISNNHIIIKVSDTGIGIAAKDLGHIFERFYQGNNVHKLYNPVGSGIGLAMVKSLTSLHHGSISVQSEEAKGSVFEVQIPIAKSAYGEHEISPGLSVPILSQTELKYLPHTEDAEEFLNNGPAPANGHIKMQMLIVDDNDEVRMYLKKTFEKQFKIIQARNGQDGLRQAEAHFPDIIISDVMMPKMDGIEFCYKLKTNERISHIPVILLTARSSDEFVIKGYETGADAYIAKPFNGKVLYARVQNLIESRRKLRTLFAQSSSLAIEEIAPTNSDEEFLKRALEIIEKNIANEDLDADILARGLGIGRTVLYEKIKALTDQTVREFIKIIRLKKASQLLVSTSLPVKEISYMVGFKYPHHFMKCFKEHFGDTPSQFANRKDK